MVVRENSEIPLDAAIKKEKMDSKKYILVKNHVREISDKDTGSSTSDESHKNVISSEKPPKNKKNKKYPSSSSDDNVNINEISKSDLKELKTVYEKCKTVLIHIESKYGHLLNLDSENEISRKRQNYTSSDDQGECNCTSNKKIVFNDDGQQVLEKGNLTPTNHICPKKLKCYDKHYVEKYQSIQIDHENLHINLPETIQELTELLKDPSIKNYLRRSIIEKIKNIRQENLNMIRFDREALIQKLKSNPEEVIDFKGTNISTLTGYK